MAESQIKITADTRQAERAIANLESALEGLNKVSDVVGKALAGVTAAAAGVAVAFKGVADQIGTLADLGKALGVSAQQLNYLQKSAQLAGVGADELNAALFRLRGNIGDALVKGTGPAVDALNRLGLSATQISQLPADQQIARITEALREVSDPAERAALSMDLLGKQGPRLLEVADNAARLAEEAKKMGIALSDAQVRAFEEAGDALDELGFIAKGVLQQAMAELAPYIIAIARYLKDAAMEGGGLGNIISSRVIPAIKLATQAMVILATYFAAAKLTAGIIAAVTALTRMYTAIKVAAGAAAVLNAVLGANPIIKIVGAIAAIGGAAVAVNSVNDAFNKLDADAKKIMDGIKIKVEEEKRARDRTVETVVRQNEEQKKALATLDETIRKLENSVIFEREKLNIGEAQANINKLIREESEKLQKVGLSLTEGQRQRITNAYLELEAVKQRASLEKTLESLQTDIITALIEDKNQRQIILAIRAKELEFNRELTQQERERLTTSIEVLQAIQQEQTIKSAMKTLDNERLLLAIADKNERDAQRQILQIQEQIGRQLTQQERERLDSAIKMTQAAREQAAIEEAITKFKGQQTELDKITRGINLQKTLGGGLAGGVTSDMEYQKDLEALQAMLDRKLISEQEYYRQREELSRQFNQKIQDLELKRIEQVLMSEKSGIAQVLNEQDKAVLQAIGAQERQRAIVRERIEFEKKSELQKTQFVIENLGNVFNALGAQNKKAFEAAKAFNIANAIMNTYMAATKALATYPWPFGVVAAAAAVAAGLAQVAQIRSQQYSGRQLGGPVMANKSYIVGENGPELFTPNNTGSITRNGDLGGGGAVTVNFNITANDATGFDQLLYSRRGLITQIISDSMQEKGRRSLV